MAFLFKGLQVKKRSQIAAFDLGSRTTKAVWLQRKGDSFELLGYTLADAPVADKNPVSVRLAEHLKKAHQELGCRGRQVVLAVGVGDALLRHAELPVAPAEDLRTMLKYNAKNYLQQDLPDHVYDCHLLAGSLKSGAEAAKPGQKCRVLVGAAKRQLVLDLQLAAKGAGLVAEMVLPGIVGPANAFESAQPEVFGKEVVALVDMGFKNTTISVLNAGELLLHRVVGIGGEKLTTGLAESMGVSSAEAEGMKLAMPDDVQMTMVPLLSPLARELRASIDFFEHQQDRPVGQVFVSGGSARSEFIVRTLKEELMLETKSWNPLGSVQLALPPQKAAELEQVAPQLTVAVGAAMAAF